MFGLNIEIKVSEGQSHVGLNVERSSRWYPHNFTQLSQRKFLNDARALNNYSFGFTNTDFRFEIGEIISKRNAKNGDDSNHLIL